MSRWKLYKNQISICPCEKAWQEQKEQYYLVCSTHKPQWALAQVKGIRGPYEAKRTFCDLGVVPTHDLQVGSAVALLIYAVNPLWSESWVICVTDRVVGKTCNRTYLIIYFLPRTMLAQCSKWSIDNYLCPGWEYIECYKTPISDTTTLCMYPIYFGGARSKAFATLRNVSKLTFLGQDWARKVCRFSVLFGSLTKWQPN